MHSNYYVRVAFRVQIIQLVREKRWLCSPLQQFEHLNTKKHQIAHSLYICNRGGIRLSEACLNDPCVSSFPVLVTQSHRGQQLVQFSVSAHDTLGLVVGLRCALQEGYEKRESLFKGKVTKFTFASPSCFRRTDNEEPIPSPSKFSNIDSKAFLCMRGQCLAPRYRCVEKMKGGHFWFGSENMLH